MITAIVTALSTSTMVVTTSMLSAGEIIWQVLDGHNANLRRRAAVLLLLDDDSHLSSELGELLAVDQSTAIRLVNEWKRLGIVKERPLVEGRPIKKTHSYLIERADRNEVTEAAEFLGDLFEKYEPPA